MTICWIDTETTGLKPDRLYLLEVACIVTDDQLVEVARLNLVTNEARSIRWDHDDAEIDEVVREMHCKNGLWGESIASRLPLHEAEDQLCAFIQQHAPTIKDEKGRDVKPVLGGSTVSYDRQVLWRHMPRAAKLLGYRHIDVSTLLEMAQRVWPAALLPKGEVAHRAMPDIEWSLHSARHYARVLRTVKA